MTIKISLPDQFGAFVEAQVTSGRYASAGEVVCEALRLMELHMQDQRNRLAWLQDAYREGIASGDDGELDVEAIKFEGRTMLGKAAD